MVLFEKGASTLKLAAMCLVAIIIVSACTDENIGTDYSPTPTGKQTVFIGSSIGIYEVFVDDVSIGKLTAGVGGAEWVEYVVKNPPLDSLGLGLSTAITYLKCQVAPGTITVRTENAGGWENFYQKFIVDKDSTYIFLDYETIRPPGSGGQLPDTL